LCHKSLPRQEKKILFFSDQAKHMWVVASNGIGTTAFLAINVSRDAPAGQRRAGGRDRSRGRPASGRSGAPAVVITGTAGTPPVPHGPVLPSLPIPENRAGAISLYSRERGGIIWVTGVVKQRELCNAMKERQ
jgi:hypothetical protein